MTQEIDTQIDFADNPDDTYDSKKILSAKLKEDSIITEIIYTENNEQKNYVLNNIDIDAPDYKAHYLVTKDDLISWIENKH